MSRGTPSSPKILPLEALGSICKELTRAQKKIVHCHGVFDLVHIGHLRHFKAARELGDVLIITLTADPYVNKGPLRPIFTEALRAEALADLSYVDYVAINPHASAIEAIKAIAPTWYVKGQDYKARLETTGSKLKGEVEAVRACGGDIYFTEDIQFSSSALINQHLSPYPQQVSDYLNKIKKVFSCEDFDKALATIRNKRVLVVGETFLDETRSVVLTPAAQATGSITGNLRSKEIRTCGAARNALCATAFADSVTLYGPQRTQSRSLEQTRPPYVAISPDVSGKYALTRERTLEGATQRVLFELWSGETGDLSEEHQERLVRELKLLLSASDIVITADYGTGFITRRLAELLAEESKFLGIFQSPVISSGAYRTPSHYPRADIFMLDGAALEREMRRPEIDVAHALEKLGNRMDIERACLVDPEEGALLRNKSGSLYNAPSLSDEIQHSYETAHSASAICSLFAAVGVPDEVLPCLAIVALQCESQAQESNGVVQSAALRRLMHAVLK
jgi:rfaE bifunctional protein nucleotidyltransferase chain/domain